jgi:hypothetical protein
MKYEGLSKYLVKLSQRFVYSHYPSLILRSGHRLCLITLEKIKKTKNSNTP